MRTSVSAAPQPRSSASGALPTEVKRVAWAVIAGLIAPILDTTIVTIALGTLSTELHAPVGTLAWVSTGYLLALAVAVPLAGWSARRFGSRAAWSTGVGVFLLGSVLCAAAWNAQSLIVFRIIQGLGAGLLFPLMTSILVAAGGGLALGRLVSMVTLPTALGPILGPVAGGIILNWLDWRWLFLVNVPICAVALVLARRIPDDREPERTRFDVLGLVLMAPGLTGILIALSNAHNGFGHPDVLIPGIVGVVLLGVFAVRGVRSRRDVLVDVRVLTRRSVAASSIGLFFFGAASFGAMLVLPLYFQVERGESVLAAALLLIPQGVGALLTRTVAGRLTDRIGARWVAVAGFALVTVATVPFAFAGPTTDQWWLMAMLLVRGLGLGTLLSPVMAAAFIGLSPDERHDASMVTRTFQQVGGSFGTAVLGAVLTAATAATAGFQGAFWCAVILSAVGAILSVLLPAATR